jgi:hypothetical protein
MEIIAQMASSRGQQCHRINISGIARSVLFIVALFVGTHACALDFPITCTCAENQPAAGLEPHARCAAVVGVSLRISDEHLAKMSYTTGGLASALIDGHWYYVRPNGDLLQVVTFDNGADYFSEGLTRSVVRGKVAYFDGNFRRVIPPKFDWGWPFEAGRALVCMGCKPTKRDEDGHGSMDGGDGDSLTRAARKSFA